MSLHRLLSLAPIALSPLVAAQSSAAPAKAEPWRLESALGLPEWLSLSGTQRTRFEYLDGQFRANSSNPPKTYDDSDHLFALRTTLRADMRLESFIATAELMDSRQYEADTGSALDTTTVNAAEFVQVFAGYAGKGVVREGDTTTAIVGRHTMDLGNRRLVARNDFRNTTNNFDGINLLWESASKSSLRAFYTLPVRRLPTDEASLLDNGVELDESTRQVQFWGLYGTLAELFPKVQAELYWLELDEQDSAGLATADRDLTTLGLRSLRKPAKGEFDFELESAWQFGSSHSNTTSGVELDHRARFHHLEAGYTFDASWKPRLAFQYDLATGDDSASDGENNRFDTLFGARRWELGPTGIFGALARANLVSPGWRVTANPSDALDLMFVHRLAHLESDTDAYTPGNVRDPSGNSGDEVGQLVEFRARWSVLPGNITLDFGVAHLFAGEFLDSAPNATGNGDTSYVYLQTLLSF
ncbi:MAG: hypothetical protein FJ294_02200 [Planctomycetes bacterium]|nr:hypothetical protein [Planctomycetota bacterium]